MSYVGMTFMYNNNFYIKITYKFRFSIKSVVNKQKAPCTYVFNIQSRFIAEKVSTSTLFTDSLTSLKRR